MKTDLVSFSTLSHEDVTEIFLLTRWMKEERPPDFRPLAGKTATLIFEKPSLRTRLSFEVGVMQLGGQTVFLSQDNIGLDTRESVRDIAEVVSGYSDLIIARTFRQEAVDLLAHYSDVPVINALTDLLHPCQILADAYTLHERGLLSAKTKITFVGDGNNVVNSWLELAAIIPLHFVLACPEGYEPNPETVSRARRARLSTIEIMHDPFEAAEGSHVLYTDVWVSMGQEDEIAARRAAFGSFQLNSRLMGLASPACVVMHCLPAHRGEEITAEVLEGGQSIVQQQAVNRLHVQKGIIAHLFGKTPVTAQVQEEQVEELVH